MYQITKTKLPGCLELIPHIFEDFRGTTVKPFYMPGLKEVGIDDIFEEDLIVNSKKGVIRGLHFQNPPFEQAKLIQCIKGSIIDVVVDLRKESDTYGEFLCFYLDDIKHNLVYVPKGCAHGYGVLQDNTIVGYKMSSIYTPEHDSGIRWNSLNIPWGIKNPILSEKDKNLPIFKHSK